MANGLSVFLKNNLLLHKVTVCLTCLGQLLRFFFIFWLREFSLSAVANGFELRCQLMQLSINESVTIVLQNLPSLRWYNSTVGSLEILNIYRIIAYFSFQLV